MHIRAVHAQSKGEYGWARVWKELLWRGVRVGKQRVQKLMQQHGIKARSKRKYKATTDSNHSLPIGRMGFPTAHTIVSLTQTEAHFPQIVEAIAPQGQFGLIDDPASLDISAFKRKSVSVRWELMFTRALFGTADMAARPSTPARAASAPSRRSGGLHRR